MMTRKKLIFIFAVSLLSCRFTCTLLDNITPKPNSLTIVNNFSVPILVEIWSGTNLVYDKGNVNGDNVKNEQKVVSISNIDPDNTLVISPSAKNIDLIIVFGTDQGTDGYVYLTEFVIKDYSGSGTVVLKANGDITLQ